jgi:hypothetical protein
MSAGTGQKIIDGDGHVVEDIATIWKYMPEEYIGKSFSDALGRSPFPTVDHLHTANRHFTPRGAFANVGREGWELFLEDVGIGTTVLYTSAGLTFGKIVSRHGRAQDCGQEVTGWIRARRRKSAAIHSSESLGPSGFSGGFVANPSLNHPVAF